MALAVVTLVAGGVAAATTPGSPGAAHPTARHAAPAPSDGAVASGDPSGVPPGTVLPPAGPGAPTQVPSGGPVLADVGHAAPKAAPARTLPPPLPEPNRASAPGGAAPDRGSGAVWPGDFPDPFVLPSAPMYYAYSTQVGLTDVPTIRSTDLVDWQWVGDALPRLPSWASWGYLWAPSVLSRGATYVLYYTTRDSATDRQCLSRAVSAVPQGPFVDSSSGPLVCQTDRGGSIDPSPFVDRDGTPYLQWQSEGTLNGEPPRVWSQQLTADGLDLVGQPRELITQDQGWEFPIVEAPSMFRDGNRYYLFYSGNRWQTAAYAIGYAVCASAVGPCTKPSSSPLLASSGSLAGPGGESVFTDATGATRLAYHAWTQPDVGYPKGARRLHISSLSFVGGQPVVR